MSNIDFSIAEMSVKEFMALDPWYWSREADKYYPYISNITEASKRAERRRSVPKKGEIYWYDFDIVNHAVRPGLIIDIDHHLNVICPLGSIEHRKDWDKFEANIKVQEPLRSGNYLPNRSFAITNRFRYIEPDNFGEKIGDARWINYEEIRNNFIKNILVDGELPKESIMFEELIDLEDISDILDDI